MAVKSLSVALVCQSAPSAVSSSQVQRTQERCANGPKISRQWSSRATLACGGLRVAKR